MDRESYLSSRLPKGESLAVTMPDTFLFQRPAQRRRHDTTRREPGTQVTEASQAHWRATRNVVSVFSVHGRVIADQLDAFI
jgi:hypothetical protein